MFKDDPLIYHGKINFGWMAAIMKSTEEVESLLPRITLPTLLIHGSEDSMVPRLSSEFAFAAISSDDKRLEVIHIYAHHRMTNKTAVCTLIV